jgi:HNH endonuclease
MNWIRPVKRLAIYLRDGLACAWCGESIEDGAKLTLDHLTPHSRGGSNDQTNLVTCCHRCNSSRGNRSVKSFAGACAGYLDHGIAPSDILSHIRQTVRRPLDIAAAAEMISRRGGFTAALRK